MCVCVCVFVIYIIRQLTRPYSLPKLSVSEVVELESPVFDIESPALGITFFCYIFFTPMTLLGFRGVDASTVTCTFLTKLIYHSDFLRMK